MSRSLSLGTAGVARNVLKSFHPLARSAAMIPSLSSLKKLSVQISVPRHYGSGSRNFATYSSIIDYDDDLDTWPRARSNTILNVCPQGNLMVVERLGKLQKVEQPGWFLAIPFIDQISYVVDMREKTIAITPQSGITKDNVHVAVSGNLYCQFFDAERAAYGSKNPIYAVKQLAQSTMRAAIGELELDEILHARAHLNTVIQNNVQDSARNWGVEIKRYEITEIAPDRFITEAMDKQAAAERERRKKVLEAEGDKRAAELESEGLKIRLKNESEGTMIKIKNEAEAKKQQLLLEAEGQAEAIRVTSEAHSAAIQLIANSLESPSAKQAAQFTIAKDYIEMYGIMGQKSNTMIFSERAGDVNALMAQAASVFGASKDSKLAKNETNIEKLK